MTPLKAKQRMEARGKWKADIEKGTLDLKAVFWTDEKIFRLGAPKGGSQNLAVYVGNNVKNTKLATI